MRAAQLAPTALLLLPLALGACVQVNAPDKPIQIDLNVNIKQEVVVKIQREAEDLVKQHPGVF